MAPAPRLRMDRSRPHGTIHGERLPGDVHQNSHYSQDGMFFDAGGFLLYDLIQDEKVKKLADQRIKKLAAIKPAKAGADGADNDPGDTSPGDPSDVNLDAWLRGEMSYDWHLITKLVRERYSQNISSKLAMVEFLVFDEKIIAEDQVAPDLRALLPRG